MAFRIQEMFSWDVSMGDYNVSSSLFPNRMDKIVLVKTLDLIAIANKILWK